MKAATQKELIEVDDLRVGMFIHLDMSWMSHPFPLGSFKISNLEQVATIRSLGVQRVRWSPNQSDAPPPVEIPTPSPAQTGPAPLGGVELAASTPAAGVPAAPVVPGSPGADPHPEGRPDGATEARVDGEHPTFAPSPTFAHSSTLAHPSTFAPEHISLTGRTSGHAPLDADEAAARAAHKRQLSRQRVALQVCERQFAEAAHDCKHLTDLVPHKPAEAREQAEQLSKALVDKMLGEQELCIRLLSDAAGDKASMHALNVTIISLLMGRTFGLAESDMQDLGVGAMLHDIGKIELPDRVRHREDHFSGSEVRFYEEHVAHGVGFARKMGLSPGATLVIAQHHEHADGSGFPLRLNTDRMTAASRIVSLVNRYDNLCNPNVAAKALTPHESLSLLFAQGKSKFDTAILGAFIRMMGVYPAGSTVQLTDDRFAMVVAVNSTRPLKPRVLIHEAKVPREEALIVDLETSQGLGIRRSIKPAQLPVESLEYLSPRPRVAYFFEPVMAAVAEPLAA